VGWGVLVEDGAQEIETGFDFDVGVVGFDYCGDDGEVVVFCADVVRGRNFCDINIYKLEKPVR